MKRRDKNNPFERLLFEHMFDYTSHSNGAVDLYGRPWRSSKLDRYINKNIAWKLIMPLSIGDLRGGALAQREREGLFTGTGLDKLLGASGIPRGRLTEVLGGPSSGKTSIAFALLAACTRAGLLGAYVDPKSAFFGASAAGAGVTLPRLLVVRPPNAEAARRAVDALVRCGACALVVFDCTGMGDVLRAHQCARLASQAEKTGTALLALSGGDIQALASFASLRLRASGLAPLWQEGSAGSGRLAGCDMSVEIVKSRMSAPGKSAVIRAFVPDVHGSWPLAVPVPVPVPVSVPSATAAANVAVEIAAHA